MISQPVSIAVVDCALGNLQSIRNAFAHVGVDVLVTSDRARIEAAQAIVLPGVGAFGDAMQALRERGLADALRAAARAGTPLVGICLGMQLLLSESEEFGRHEGLGIVPGRVRRFPAPHRSPAGHFDAGDKVPQVGWNRIAPPAGEAAVAHWKSSPLEGLEAGVHMYFMHSYYAEPDDPAVALCTTRYAGVDYCSGLMTGSVVAFQFHPERSAEPGLAIYRNLVRWIRERGAPRKSG
ncbi:MAG TPA: imidazole glycerol phosphate synthase subunit HisH [Myxococcota bacterium]|nr:imidazole glycerol phosphate synthase subunit HisH [Myxococcota bacterium]